MPLKKDEDAAAAAELFVDKGGRKPVEGSRKVRYCKDGSSGWHGGEQEGHAERSAQEVSREGILGIQGVGGAKGKRSLGARAKETHAYQVGRRRGKSKIFQRLGRSRAIRHLNDARDSMSVESNSSSMACDVEEAGSESSRKMRDKEETTSEASWTVVTKEKKMRCGG